MASRIVYDCGCAECGDVQYPCEAHRPQPTTQPEPDPGEDYDWLDADGYPTESALERIATWPVADGTGLLDFVRSLWCYPTSEKLNDAEAELTHAAYWRELNPERHLRYLRLATGGWSVNESLIRALRKNIIGRLMWRLSAAGGLHIYQYPEEEAPHADQ